MTDTTWTAPAIAAPSAQARAAAEERFAGLATPPGALGRLGDIGAWVAACQGQCPPTPLQRPRVVVPAGDHGVAASGVSAFPPAITAAMVRGIHAGGAGVSALAGAHGASVRVLDISVDDDLEGIPAEVKAHKLGRGCGSIDREDAMGLAETTEALQVGAAIVAEERTAGCDLLIVGDLGIGNTTPSAALIASILDLPAERVTGRGTGLDDEGLSRKTGVVRAALTRTEGVTDPLARLASLGSPDIAVAVGMYVAAAASGLPIVLDGVISVAEALVAHTLAPGVTDWMVAGHRSPEPAQSLALDHLGLVPLVDLDMRLGEGSGAVAGLPVVQSAIAALRDVALLADVMGGA